MTHPVQYRGMSARNALIGGGVGVGATVLSTFGVNAVTNPDFTRPWWREPETVAVGVGAAAGLGAITLDTMGRLDLNDTAMGAAAGIAAGGAGLLLFAGLLNANFLNRPRLLAARSRRVPA